MSAGRRQALARLALLGTIGMPGLPATALAGQAAAPRRQVAAQADGSLAATLAWRPLRLDLRTTRDAQGTWQLQLQPHGLQRDNSPLSQALQGRLLRAELADLDGDGAPELYLVLAAHPPGDGEQLLAFSSNRNRSLSPVFVPDLADTPALAAGHRGGDRWQRQGRRWWRSFPLVGPDGQPLGQMRRVPYRLVAGEAGWRLQPAAR